MSCDITGRGRMGLRGNRNLIASWIRNSNSSSEPLSVRLNPLALMAAHQVKDYLVKEWLHL